MNRDAENIRLIFADLSAGGADVREDTLVSGILQSVSKEGLMSLARRGAEEIVRTALVGDSISDDEPVAEEVVGREKGRQFVLFYRPLPKAERTAAADPPGGAA